MEQGRGVGAAVEQVAEFPSSLPGVFGTDVWAPYVSVSFCVTWAERACLTGSLRRLKELMSLRCVERRGPLGVVHARDCQHRHTASASRAGGTGAAAEASVVSKPCPGRVAPQSPRQATCHTQLCVCGWGGETQGEARRAASQFRTKLFCPVGPQGDRIRVSSQAVTSGSTYTRERYKTRPGPEHQSAGLAVLFHKAERTGRVSHFSSSGAHCAASARPLTLTREVSGHTVGAFAPQRLTSAGPRCLSVKERGRFRAGHVGIKGEGNAQCASFHAWPVEPKKQRFLTSWTRKGHGFSLLVRLFNTSCRKLYNL